VGNALEQGTTSTFEEVRTTSTKRTTVQLDEQDQETLKELARRQRLTEMESIRRSIRLANDLMAWQESGGEIVLQRDRERERLRFVM
jgi:hypothetical protein